VLLIHPAGGPFTDRLLDLLADAARAGEGGRQFADLVCAACDADAATAADSEGSEPGPLAVAFGPAGDGTAVTIYGTAWAEITTAHGGQLLSAGQPYGRLRCVLPSRASKVRAGVHGSDGSVGTDRYLRLVGGIVRAVGLLYIPEDHAPADAARPAERGAPADGAAVLAPEEDDRAAAESAAAGVPDGGQDERAVPAGGAAVEAPGQAAPAAAEGAAAAAQEAAQGLAAAAQAAAQEAGQDERAVPAGGAAAQAPGQDEHAVPDSGGRRAADAAAQDFIAVPLGGDRPEAGGQARAALPLGSEPPDEADLGTGEKPPPVVLGVYCKNGHFDDPEARYCAVCGIGMAQLTKVPRTGPRPPLGVLVLDDGSVFQLNADYVLGREPSLDASVADGSARPLRLAGASGLVSRIHARVELDGWQVYVSDLSSANGTFIRLPGEKDGKRLVPGDRTPLVVGAHVRLGRDCGFRYDSHRHR
jgi:hypothetical protein